MASSSYYDGSRMFSKLAEYVGLETDQANFVISQFVALALASLFRTVLHPSKTRSGTRHGFGLIFGLIIGYFCYGMQAIHLAGLPALCYIVIRTTNPHIMQRMVLAVAIIYLSCIHLHRQVYDYGSYTLDISGPLMIVTQKVTSLAFCIHDGIARAESELTKSQRLYAVRKIPSALEYFSYVLQFPTIMAGPALFYKDYADFIDGNNLLPKTPSGNLDRDLANRTVVHEPSPARSVCRKVFMSITCAVIFVKFLPMFPIQAVKEDDFVERTSLLYKFWYLNVATLLVRFKYYFAWLFADAICNNSGIGYDESGANWDKFSNINILKFELGTNLKESIEAWNIGTNMWLRRVVYDRVTEYPTVCTYALSALWHGFYPGYYITFANGALFTFAARKMRRAFRDHFTANSELKLMYDAATFVTTRFVMAYITYTFVLLEFWAGIRLYLGKDTEEMLQFAVFATVVSFHACYVHSITDGVVNATDLIEYVLLDKSHPCLRTCTKDTPPMVCRYTFTMEWYQTLSKACYSCPYDAEDCKRPHCITGDGRTKSIVVVNRQMPGPNIEVCLGDEIIVDLRNRLMGETTTIHWHGHHQRGTPYMDGVPYVTQCPIQPGSNFRYNFVANNVGTHFWHSHTGMQRADGAFGSFIVRTPEDPHRKLYDYDLSAHVMIVLDWCEETGTNKFVAHHHSNGDNKPTTLLVNGRGRFKEFIRDNVTVYTPTERFVVEKGFRYRFRIINAEFLNCPIEVSVDNHTITIISTDGNDVEAVQAESVVTYAGERFDFVLNADQPKGLYWIRFRGLMDCDRRFKGAHQVAVLQYSGTSDDDYPEDEPHYDKSHKEGLQVNALNKGTEENTTLSVAEMRSLDDDDASLKPEPDFKYFISYDFYKLDNPHYHNHNLYGFHDVSDKEQQLLTPQLNHISMILKSFPLLSGRDNIKTGMFCNESTVENCVDGYCECTHVVQVPLGSVVELILIDKGFAFDANHPFHLHGHAFRVVGMKKLGKNTTTEAVLRLDEQGLLERNLRNPPLKDTVTVPDGGYTIVRFVASNPGYWLFHCHIEFHVEVGMSLVFKFGEHEQMPPVPRNFPQCGDYTTRAANSTTLWSWLLRGSNGSETMKLSMNLICVAVVTTLLLR